MAKIRNVEEGPATKRTGRKTPSAKKAPKKTRTAQGVTKPTQQRGRAKKVGVKPKRTAPKSNEASIAAANEPNTNKAAEREGVEGTIQRKEGDNETELYISIGGMAPRAVDTASGGEKPTLSTITKMTFKDDKEERQIIVTERVVGDWYSVKDGDICYKCSDNIFQQWMAKAIKVE
jgi:hypothetical protein